MSGMNKAFAYIFNTTREDQKVAKHLSGWDADDNCHLPSLRCFGDQSERLAVLRDALFGSSRGFIGGFEEYNIREEVADVLTATMLMHYPEMKSINSQTPYIAPVQDICHRHGFVEEELLTYSSVVRADFNSMLFHDAKPTSDGTALATLQAQLHEQSRLMVDLVQQMTRLVTRVEQIETHCLQRPSQGTSVSGVANSIVAGNEVTTTELDESPRRKEAPQTLSACWFQWYTEKPWLSSQYSRQKMNEKKCVVGFMKLFLPGGYDIPSADDTDFKSNVARLGAKAEEGVLQFLSRHGHSGTAPGTMLKHMRGLVKTDALSDHIRQLQQNILAGKIVDSTPVKLRYELKLTANIRGCATSDSAKAQ